MSKSQLRKLCKQNFVSPTRMAEWQSIHTQLTQICRQLGFSLNHEPAKPDNIHCALLSGLSSHIALKDQSFDYIGARQTRLKIFPGSTLFRSAPKWFVAYELVETSQLYARTVARINPEWCLKTAPHLVQYDYIEPQWDEKQQRITVTEKASLYGLMLYANKKRPYAKVNAVDCRKLFIEQALVTHALASEAAWLEHNRQLVDELHLLEKKQRRPGIIDEENLFAFYDAKLPNDVNDLQSLDRWRRQAEKTTKEILFLRREQLLDDSLHEQINTFFPDELQLNTINLPLQYQFSPGEKHDGISIDVPIQVLNQISEQQLDRLVPGLIRDKTESLLKSLPKSIRQPLVP